jgi:phage recombination protein Bet
MSNLTVKDREDLVQRVSELVPADMMKWSPAEIVLIRERTPEKVDNTAFLGFLLVAARAGLNPIENDIYALPYFDKQKQRTVTSIITGIGGIRKTAQRTGRYLGMTAPVYYDSKGNGTEIWVGGGPPHAVKIGVRVRDCAEPTWAIVYWSEYGGTEQQWKWKPVHMLTKVAEAHALRKVFPECGGLYEEAEADAIQGRKPVENTAGTIDLSAELREVEAPKPVREVVDEVKPARAPSKPAPKMPIDPTEFVQAVEDTCYGRGLDSTTPGWLLAKEVQHRKVADIHGTTTAQRQAFWDKLHDGGYDQYGAPEGRAGK